MLAPCVETIHKRLQVSTYVLETEQESFAHYSSSAFYIISLSLSSCKQTSFHVIIYIYINIES